MASFLQSDVNIYKLEKIAAARDFISKLPKKYIAFAGISGSVSYDPLPEDDIDIFIISRKNQLWLLLIYAFLARRILGNQDICISLCMDTEFAHNFFTPSMDGLQKQDANHVIPVSGKEYFSEILRRMEESRKSPPMGKYASDDATGFSRHTKIIVNLVAYILLASYLNVKGLIFNHRMNARGTSDHCYTVRAGTHHFYLDTQKYARLRSENISR